MWKPPLFPKQEQLYDCDKRFILATGARYSGKTYGLMHKLMRHLWRLPKARVGIITMTTRQGDYGVWSGLSGYIYDTWKNAGVCSENAEFGWVMEPKTNNVSKMREAVLRNRFGEGSEVVLFPVQRPEEAESKLFSTEWTGIWISEAHLFKSDKLFRMAIQQLRLPGIDAKDTFLWCDCNPPEEGQDHWLYKAFYENLNKDPESIDERDPETLTDEELAERAENIEAFREFQSQLAVFEFMRHENTFIDKQQAMAIRAANLANKDDYDRFEKGLWSRASSFIVFSGIFDPNVHVVGEAHGDESEWEVIAPSDEAHAVREGGVVQLVDGWDPGEVNHAHIILQPWRNSKGELCFDVLDELVIINEGIPLDEFAVKAKEKRVAMEEFAGFPVVWRGYADSSIEVFRKQRISTDDQYTDAGVIAKVAGVELIGSSAVKKPGWVRRRANWLSLLLQRGRLRVSANCKQVIGMFKDLRRSQDEGKPHYLAEQQPNKAAKHVFDALSYPITMMTIDELLDPVGPKVQRRILTVKI